MVTISDQEFDCFRRFIFDSAGITLAISKKQLVSGRLSKRLLAHQLSSFQSYYELLQGGTAPQEMQIAIDLLTTNETYFFRESKHFDVLRSVAEAAPRGAPFNVWSAACSSGEEPYSIAMVLADVLDGRPWDLLGSDISTRMLERARSGHYPMERVTHMPEAYKKRFCLKGVGQEDGTLLVQRALRQRLRLQHINLNEPLPQIGSFDVIFLRNVLIYFNPDTKRQVVERVLSALKPGGYFFIGHSESLHQVTSTVTQVAPAIYRKPF